MFKGPISNNKENKNVVPSPLGRPWLKVLSLTTKKTQILPRPPWTLMAKIFCRISLIYMKM